MQASASCPDIEAGDSLHDGNPDASCIMQSAHGRYFFLKAATDEVWSAMPPEVQANPSCQAGKAIFYIKIRSRLALHKKAYSATPALQQLHCGRLIPESCLQAYVVAAGLEKQHGARLWEIGQPWPHPSQYS